MNTINQEIRRLITSKLVRFLAIVILLQFSLSIINILFTETSLERIILFSILLSGYLLMILFHRQKKDYAACVTIVIVWTIFAVIGIFLQGGILSPTYIFLFIIIIFMSWIVNSKLTIAYAAGVIFLGFLSIYLQSKNIITPDNNISIMRRMINYTNFVITIAGVQVLGQKSLINSIKENQKHLSLQKSIFQSIDNALYVFDINNCIMEQNTEAENLFYQFSNNNSCNSILDIEFEFNNSASKTLSEILVMNNYYIKNLNLRYKDTKKTQWFSISSSPLVQSGQFTGKVLTLRDITEQKIMEYNQEISQKMETVGQLASGVSHDFNNMLGAIKGASDLLSIDATDEQKKMLNLIDQAVGKATKLTKELLLFTRKAQKKSTLVDIHRIIKEVIFLLSRTVNKKIKINSNLAAEKYHIIGDDSQIQNVLMNMGINSSHAMSKGGTLTYSTDVLQLNKEYCKKSKFDLVEGSYINIKVNDTGVGMSNDVIGHIFEPFFTTKEVGKGTGLGLSAVYGMIQKHKGAITVESTMGVGTCFSILLPLASEKSSNEAPEEDFSYTTGTGSVLVVDDELYVLMTTKELLEKIGYTIYTARNGREAIDFLEKNSVDVVIMDSVMPVMNGREAFEKIHLRWNKLPVILTSGFTEESDIQDMKDKGLSAFLSKPFNSFELSKLLYELLYSICQDS